MEITIRVIDRDNQHHVLQVPTDMGLNLMEVLRSEEQFQVEGTCGGMALCASCQVYVETLTAPFILERNEAEEEMLDQAFFVQKNSRLACQIPISLDIDGYVFKIAPNS